MNAPDFLSLYTKDSFVKLLAKKITTSPTKKSIHLKGLSGSLDAIIVAALYENTAVDQLIVLEDKEEALYFLNDLQSLLPHTRVLFFPMSYKKAYEYEEIQNANIIMRTETLHRLHGTSEAQLIISYPEALAEKTATKKSLIANTFSVTKGTPLSLEALQQFLFRYDFQKVDLVEEPGRFALRGGIVDIYSFSHELPYRIELFGNDVESIRRFDPESQLSIGEVDTIGITPNMETAFLQETRQGLLTSLAPSTQVWIKDVQLTSDILAKSLDTASERFRSLLHKTGKATIGLDPQDLFESPASFLLQLEKFHTIEFGNRFYFPPFDSIVMSSSAQLSFNKNFNLLTTSLVENTHRNYTNFIASAQPKQQQRVGDILEEIDSNVSYVPLLFSIRSGFIDHNTKINCYTDHQLFDRFYQGKEKINKAKAITLRALQKLQPGDFVTHIDHGIGKFAGMEKNGKKQESIRLIFRDNDILYVSIHALHKLSRYASREGSPPLLNKLGTKEWGNKKARVKRKVKDIAKELIALYAKRKKKTGYSFSADTFLQEQLESSFIYVDTPDQASASEDVKQDMETPHPMDRLVCGDVGFGKTEIAIRAAFKAVADSKQVAILVPTTILALQHYRTFGDRLQPFPVTIEYISRFKSGKQTTETLKNIAEGKTDIIIGTHRLASRDITFRNLGLLIIDEEQKFGVKTKERLKEFKINVDTLTLTATPIPRTLHFSLMGARDLSIITTPPPNRQAVTTELHTYNETIIRDVTTHELQRNGQVFFVHHRVKDIEQLADVMTRLIPDARIGIAHGQMDGKRLEKTMMRFINGDYDILVSTNIIESGLDIPNANTIIINQAHMFGLSDLYQMRGRVGRSNKKAFCYLLTPPASTLSSDARKRLATLEELSNLGDGLKVAMRDLEIRGAGNLLGAEQTGFINDLGFDAYHKILDDAVQELKENEFESVFSEEVKESIKSFSKECIIETDMEILIPEHYVENASERMHLYITIDNLQNEKELENFQHTLRDRFGSLPEAVLQLIDTLRLRWIGKKLGMNKIVLKAKKLKAHLVTGKDAYFQSNEFAKILTFVQKRADQCTIKDMSGKCVLMLNDINSISESLATLNTIASGLPTRVINTTTPTKNIQNQ